jgi:hypothetical protein
MNLSLRGATEFVKAKTPGIKVFIPKLLCYHMHEKKHVHFYWNYMSFCVFFSSFLAFSYSCFISFKLSIFQFLKIHNCTDLKLVRKQHWNFNEQFNFYILRYKINTLFTVSGSPDEKNCALGLENFVRPLGSGCFQDLGHSLSHPDLAAGK